MAHPQPLTVDKYSVPLIRIATAAIAWLSLGFLSRLPRRVAALLGASGLLYVGGALGMELVASQIAQAFYEAHPGSAPGGFAFMSTPLYALEVTVEESLEFLAEFLYVFSALTLLELEGAVIELRFGRAP